MDRRLSLLCNHRGLRLINGDGEVWGWFIRVKASGWRGGGSFSSFMVPTAMLIDLQLGCLFQSAVFETPHEELDLLPRNTSPLLELNNPSSSGYFSLLSLSLFSFSFKFVFLLIHFHFVWPSSFAPSLLCPFFMFIMSCPFLVSFTDLVSCGQPLSPF